MNCINLPVATVESYLSYELYDGAQIQKVFSSAVAPLTASSLVQSIIELPAELKTLLMLGCKLCANPWGFSVYKLTRGITSCVVFCGVMLVFSHVEDLEDSQALHGFCPPRLRGDLIF